MLRKTAIDLPPAEILREYLSYDAETGILRWRKRDQPSHQHLVGKEALSGPTSRGYKRGGLFGRNVMAHRVIWKMVYGDDPLEIDHIDGDPTNNRLSNLRSVTRQDNVRNVRRKVGNKSGCTGVHYRRGYWIASIRHDGRQIELGYFKDKQLAIASRKSAERQFGYHPNHGRDA
jgi:hypothetical protein